MDLTLTKQADGSVAPVAHPFDLTISGAATTTVDRELASVGSGDDRVAMGWTGALPEPVLNGNRATYAEVRPGVDLVIEATLSGVETFYVVKNRAAAKEVANLTVPVTGQTVASLRSGTDGDTTLLNAQGKPVATSPAPLMWDAQISPQSGEPARIRAVKSKVTGRKARKIGRGATAIDGAGADLTLTPDMSFFADPSTVYPVTVDPQINPFKTWGDAYIKEGTSSDHGGATDLQIGVVNGDRTRSLVTWDTSGLRGKQITSATVYFYNWWSPSCSARSWDIWTTGAFDGTVTWANPPIWRYKEATSTATKGYSSSCGDGWVTVSGTSFFDRAADEQQTKGYMGIRATSETDSYSFKQFRSRNAADASQVPYAVINYNSYATVTARAADTTQTCATGTARPTITTTTPGLFAQVSDPENSQTIWGEFEWWTAGGATKIGSVVSNPVASGGITAVSVPAGAMAVGNAYAWRVRTADGTGWGPFSGFCEFRIDYEAPTIQSKSTVPASPCVTGTTRPALNTTAPTLTATASDTDSSTTDITFEWWKVGGSSALGTQTASGVPVDVEASVTIPDAVLANGGAYQWRTQARDSTGKYSGWSGFCEFTVATSAPSVTSMDYPAGGIAGGPNSAGTFTLTPATGATVSSFAYGLDQNPPATVVAASGETSIQITPPTAGQHTLYVLAYDANGMASSVVQYPFTVGTGAENDPADPSAVDKAYQPIEAGTMAPAPPEGDVSIASIKNAGSLCASKSRTITPPKGSASQIDASVRAGITLSYNKVLGTLSYADFTNTSAFVAWRGTNPYKATSVGNTVTWDIDYWLGSFSVGASPSGAVNQGGGAVTWSRTINKDWRNLLEDDLTRLRVSGTGDITAVGLSVKGSFAFGYTTYTVSGYSHSDINWNWRQAQPYLTKSC
ncbi:hypothetical protein [Krasilnikovia sp. MM14-A1004]|uniref:hypothetical protein n=1 Tax=Krasilnikovia sp. MM14-A1004 TaxID=3373541 RepID=UPI00399D1C3E